LQGLKPSWFLVAVEAQIIRLICKSTVAHIGKMKLCEYPGGRLNDYAGKSDEKLQKHFSPKPGAPVLQLNRKIATNRID
jgi:hypothetical protein